MAKCKVSLRKASGGFKAAMPASKSTKFGAEGDFKIVYNEDSSFTVLGVDAAGHEVAIDAVATLTVSSSDVAVLTVDAPTGMGSKMSAVAVGHAEVLATATWNDGSIGPFSFALPVDVVAGPAASIKIVPGTPVARP